MAINPLIIDALKKLNPTAPAAPREVIDREWEGMARGWDTLEQIETLLAADYTVRGVLHGPIGVGKTSELRRWARGLRREAKVLVVSVQRPTQALKTAEDVYGLIKRGVWSALELSEEEREEIGEDSDYEDLGDLEASLDYRGFF